MRFLKNSQNGDVKYRKVINMFNSLADISNSDDELKINAAQHLQKLEWEFISYFLELSRDDLSFAKNSFLRSFFKKVEDKLDQFIDMKNDFSF